MNYISIDGGYYKPKKEFGLFPNPKQIASIIYGKNGSGKSSIARAIKQSLEDSIENQEFENVEFFRLLSHSNQGKDETAYAKPSVPCYVHNDEFTNKNVAFNREGLATIVMFGEQIEIKKEINKLNASIDLINTEIENLENQKKSLENKSNKSSHLFLLEEIKKKLKNTWAQKEQDISGNKIAGKVERSLWTDIISLENPLDSYENLLNNFNQSLQTYKNTKSARKIAALKEIEYPKKISYFLEQLSIELPSPLLSSKEKEIFELIQSNSNVEIEKSLNLLKSDSKFCPTCLNTLDSNYKNNILSIIENILNTQEANILKQNIKSIDLGTIKLSLDIPEEMRKLIDSEKLKAFDETLGKYNTKITDLEDFKTLKALNPYKPIPLPEKEIINLVDQLNTYIKEFNFLIQKFNLEVGEKDSLLKKLKRLNKEVARKQLDNDIESYNSKLAHFEELTSSIEKKTKDKSALEMEKDKKLAELQNVNIALDLINDYLKYIFYDKNRLYLKYENQRYKIMSRGELVKPSSLSIGEKNVISLCYFFSTLFEKENISELFLKKCILVLDDPLSSFDFENKVGVYSFLRYILGELHSKNEESKSLILTHDLDVLYNMVKLYDDIGIKETDKRKKLRIFQLSNKCLSNITTNKFNEYSLLLQSAYKFVINPEDSIEEMSIGNTLRKILEAFCTFNYKCGISDISKNIDVLEKIKNPSQQEYFKNSMYRLILNSESHLEERSKQLIDASFTEHFSTNEKIKTAKDILMFLYLLDPVHIKIHLSENKEQRNSNLISSKIEEWISETFEETSLQLS